MDLWAILACAILWGVTLGRENIGLLRWLSLGNLWPLLLIAAGAYLLYRR